MDGEPASHKYSHGKMSAWVPGRHDTASVDNRSYWQTLYWVKFLSNGVLAPAVWVVQ